MLGLGGDDMLLSFACSLSWPWLRLCALRRLAVGGAARVALCAVMLADGGCGS